MTHQTHSCPPPVDSLSAISDATSSTQPAPTKPPRVRRSRSEEAEIVRAKKTARALSPLLAGIAKADAHAKEVRIDKTWVERYASLTSAAERSADGRAVRRADLKAATNLERETARQLAARLIDVRHRIATHHKDNLAAQQAFGRGARIEAPRTGPLIGLAGAFVAAIRGEFQQVARDAGITDPMARTIEDLRGKLSDADMGQHGVITVNVDGTLDRRALFQVLRSMSEFSVRVVKNVFGAGSHELQALSDPRPLTRNRKAQPAAAARRREQRRAVQKRKLGLIEAAKQPRTGAKRRGKTAKRKK